MVREGERERVEQSSDLDLVRSHWRVPSFQQEVSLCTEVPNVRRREVQEEIGVQVVHMVRLLLRKMNH